LSARRQDVVIRLQSESNMKIYLLVMLMSALLMAIRFTTGKRSSATLLMLA
jgi:hypothetical protein